MDRNPWETEEIKIPGKDSDTAGQAGEQTALLTAGVGRSIGPTKQRLLTVRSGLGSGFSNEYIPENELVLVQAGPGRTAGRGLLPRTANAAGAAPERDDPRQGLMVGVIPLS